VLQLSLTCRYNRRRVQGVAEHQVQVVGALVTHTLSQSDHPQLIWIQHISRYMLSCNGVLYWVMFSPTAAPQSSQPGCIGVESYTICTICRDESAVMRCVNRINPAHRRGHLGGVSQTCSGSGSCTVAHGCINCAALVVAAAATYCYHGIGFIAANADMPPDLLPVSSVWTLQ
jgi:hypothetical protein